jgi:molecular chaperone DnaK
MGTGWTTTIDGAEFIPQQISAFVLQKLRRDAEAHLGERVTDAVITVPSCFSERQRQATREAGRIAGLNVLRIISEPTAAALAHHLDDQGDATVLVFDLGGGSCSASVVEVGDGVVEVRAASGDNRLGGGDWDDAVVDRLVERFRNAHDVDLSRDTMALQRLREAAEKAKIELSSSSETRIYLPYIAASPEGPLHLDETLTRAGFQAMTAGLLDRCRVPFERVLKDAEIGADEIDHVVLVGGATRMPAVADLLGELTGGARPGHRVDPDEVVAVGAALQAGVLKGEVRDVLMLDVIANSLGVETPGDLTLAAVAGGGILTKMIERNTTIPTKRSELFTTAADDQPSVEIRVFEGEREIAEYNDRIGAFRLTGLPPAPRGVPQIEVAFDIDANGILNVSATDLGSGRERSMVVTGSSALPADDIERMTRQAERYAEQDRRRRERAELRDRADILVHSTERFLRENGEKLPAHLRKEAEEAVAEVERALEGTGTGTAAVRAAAEKLAQAGRRMRAAMNVPNGPGR